MQKAILKPNLPRIALFLGIGGIALFLLHRQRQGDLLNAIRQNDGDAVRNIVGKDRVALTDGEGKSLLTMAIRRKRNEAAKALLEAGADPNVRVAGSPNESLFAPQTAFEGAAACGNLAGMKLLLGNSVRLDASDKSRALALAVMGRQSVAMEFLHRQGARLTPRQHAHFVMPFARWEGVEQARFLVRQGFDLRMQNAEG